jgi:hypothetical protein
MSIETHHVFYYRHLFLIFALRKYILKNFIIIIIAYQIEPSTESLAKYLFGYLFRLLAETTTEQIVKATT